MVVLNPTDIFCESSIILKNKKGTRFVLEKAYSIDERAGFELSVDRTLGLFSPALVIWPDGESEREFPFVYLNTIDGKDVYTLNLSLRDVKDEPHLAFFVVRLSLGDNFIYFHSKNNVDGALSYDKRANPFKMTVYSPDYNVPSWYRKSVMYHIFVDRFFRSERAMPVREDAILNEDWHDGIPQFGKVNGDFCANNMFFGGSLFGIAEKLDYLKNLGVNLLYLSPIFKAYSNHKYDTGDYECVDEMFGGEEGLDFLLEECKKRKMRVILDGVFNHVGDDSKYFNRKGKYDTLGAYQSKDSKYFDWFFFKNYPDKYECWWDIEILPKINSSKDSVIDYLAGKNGIAAKYIKRGVSGFRLDVADELPDRFLETLRCSIKGENRDAIVIGEVWENAADKIAYGKRRHYFQGSQLDGVMNYPVKCGIIDFIRTGNATTLYDTVCDIYSSYPSFVSSSLMNLLGTHDTERILTVLSGDRFKGMSNEELSHFKLTDEEYERARRLLYLASVLQFTLPGTPSVFYGDEAGTQGAHDPFCRKTFPWGREDKAILAHYKKLCRIRRNNEALCEGALFVTWHSDGVFAFERKSGKETVCVIVNMSDKDFSVEAKGATDLYTGKKLSGKISVGAEDFLIIRK